MDLRQRSRAYLSAAPSTLEAISDLGMQGSDQNPFFKFGNWVKVAELVAIVDLSLSGTDAVASLSLETQSLKARV